MIHDPQNFVLVDPRTFDGTPYEVAGRSVAQLQSMYRLIELSLEGTEAMVRNAQMERDLEEAGAARPWADSPQSRILTRVRQQTADTIIALEALEKAASFDPKHPPVA